MPPSEERWEIAGFVPRTSQSCANKITWPPPHQWIPFLINFSHIYNKAAIRHPSKHREDRTRRSCGRSPAKSFRSSKPTASPSTSESLTSTSTPGEISRNLSTEKVSEMPARCCWTSSLAKIWWPRSWLRNTVRSWPTSPAPSGWPWPSSDVTGSGRATSATPSPTPWFKRENGKTRPSVSSTMVE